MIATRQPSGRGLILCPLLLAMESEALLQQTTERGCS
jgi:hypothetical protein